MNRRTALVALSGLAGFGGWTAARAAVGPDRSLAALLADGPDGVVSAGAILRHGDGRPLFAEAVGRKRMGPAPGHWDPFGLEDPFRVASVSKMVATTGFLQLVEQGRVGLDDDAGMRLGFRLRHPAFPDQPITVRHLLSHTSGLRNGPSYPVPAGHDLREAFDPAGRHFDGGAWFGPREHAPGRWFAYADVNFCLIAQMLEVVTGERFDHFMTRTVLAPLSLDAGYNWSGVSAAKRARAARALRWLDGGWTDQVDGSVPPWPQSAIPQPRDGPAVAEADLRLGSNGFLFSPQGGLRLSLADMDRLAALYRHGGTLDGHRILSAKSLDLMQTPAWTFDPMHPNGETAEGEGTAGLFKAYGLAMEIPQGRRAGDGDAFFGADSPDWRGHLGDAYGWLTGLFWNRRDGRTLVYAINGIRETGGRVGRRSALTEVEERLIDTVLSPVPTVG